MFSSLVKHFSAPTNRLYQERDRRAVAGERIIDLVSGNVHQQGIQFPEALLESAMRSGLRKTKIYKPHPLGQMATRQAICRYYRDEGLTIKPEQILLTPGTSLAYLYAFKLLA